jgi:hypothetical protein
LHTKHDPNPHQELVIGWFAGALSKDLVYDRL